MIKKLDVDFLHTDERGTICQVLSIPITQVNYLFTKRAAKRGCHYHKINREIFYIIEGSLEVTAEKSDDNTSKHIYSFKTGDVFLVEPLVVHDFNFLEDTRMLVMYDKGVELPDKSKDIYSAEVD